MSDLYDKIKEDVAFHRKWAERCGFGFNHRPSKYASCSRRHRPVSSSRVEAHKFNTGASR
jgi:hypothetical protein